MLDTGKNKAKGAYDKVKGEIKDQYGKHTIRKNKHPVKLIKKVNRMNFIIAITRYASTICSCKRINTTTYCGDVAINRYDEIH